MKRNVWGRGLCLALSLLCTAWQLCAQADTPQPAQPRRLSDKSPQKLYFHPYAENPHGSSSDENSSVYVPVDNWMYPAITRLYSLGYMSTLYLGMRPWTRRSILHALQASQMELADSSNEEATAIFDLLLRELQSEVPGNLSPRENICCLESAYTRLMGVRGDTLRDSFHIGQTIVNDYGRPYQPGFNNITGLSTVMERGRFSLYVRGEYQHSPAAAGYSQALASQLSFIDEVPYSPAVIQATIPVGPIAAQNNLRLQEATLSFHLAGHEISGGKSDAWLGAAQGGAMAWSNNAENIYSFRINRVEPLHIPLLSKLTGPIRYDFFYGSLKGHTDPNSPWVHAEMFSMKPTRNLEFSFERTVIFGGKGHEPVTLHTFLHSFFSLADVGINNLQVKQGAQDPGARYSDFGLSYRLPFVRNYLTFYVDSIAHDDVTPPSAPRRAAYRTGLFLSQFPAAHKLSFRVEAVSTDPGVSRSMKGQFNYYETVQRQGYTNKGFIMGDWIGREAKGGQAWLTYHLSGNESLELEYLNKKTPKDFMPGGTTQNSFKLSLVKRIGPNLEVNAWVQHEIWKAPVYAAGENANTIGIIQLTYYPALHSYGSR